MNGHIEPHGLRLSIAFARHIAPFLNGLQGCGVQAIKAAGGFEFHLAGRAVGLNQCANHDQSLFPQTLGQARVGRLGVVQVVRFG